MIRNYRDLTRLEMEQVNKDETIVLIPLGALEQHGNQAPLGTDDIIAEAMTFRCAVLLLLPVAMISKLCISIPLPSPLRRESVFVLPEGFSKVLKENLFV